MQLQLLFFYESPLMTSWVKVSSQQFFKAKLTRWSECRCNTCFLWIIDDVMSQSVTRKTYQVIRMQLQHLRPIHMRRNLFFQHRDDILRCTLSWYRKKLTCPKKNKPGSGLSMWLNWWTFCNVFGWPSLKIAGTSHPLCVQRSILITDFFKFRFWLANNKMAALLFLTIWILVWYPNSPLV